MFDPVLVLCEWTYNVGPERYKTFDVTNSWHAFLLSQRWKVATHLRNHPVVLCMAYTCEMKWLL
jgi:hypothetical protein